MKTKILKFGMPLMAFLLAIVFAFATDQSTQIEDDTLISGYILNPGGCDPAPKNCRVEGTTVCKYQNKSVHKDSDCDLDFLYEWM